MLCSFKQSCTLPVKACPFIKQHVAPAAVQGSNTPYQVSSGTYTLEARDPGIISALRSFGRLLASTPLGSTAYLKRIKDIRAGGFFDIICRVTSWHDDVCATCLALQHTAIIHAAIGTGFFANTRWLFNSPMIVRNVARRQS